MAPLPSSGRHFCPAAARVVLGPLGLVISRPMRGIAARLAARTWPCNCARRASAADRLLNLAFDASRRVWQLITYQKDEPSKRSPYVESLHGRGLGFRGRRLNSATRTASRPCLLCHQILIVRSAARIAACRVPSIDPCLGLGDEWTIQTHWFFPMALLIS